MHQLFVTKPAGLIRKGRGGDSVPIDNNLFRNVVLTRLFFIFLL